MRGRTGLLLGMLFVVLVTALWFLFVISPMNGRIAELRQQREAAESEEMTLRTTLQRLQEIQEAELTYIAAVGALEEMVPPSPDLADLIDQLNVLKEETGVIWASITPGLPAEVEGEEYLQIPVTIDIEGQYFETLGYLYGLAELERLVRVDAIDISSEQTEEGFTMLNVTLSAAIFTTGDIGPLPPEETTTTTTTSTTTTTAPATTTTTAGGG